jgi:type IV secretion system protein VirB4
MAEIAEQAVAQAGPDPAAWLPVYLDTVRQSRQIIANA